MKNRRLLGIFLSIFLTLALLPLFTVPAEAAGDVQINSSNFPDANFRNYLLTYNNGSYTLAASKIASTTRMDLHGLGITDLKGVEFFTELTQLYFYDNDVTSADLRSNKKLQYLYCWNNPSLTTMYLSGCNDLLSVDARSTALQSLDVSGRESLVQLQVSQNPSLQTLRCSNCDLSQLNLAGCTALKTLNCEYNGISQLDLRYCPALSSLNCSGNGMTVLDVSACTELLTLHCYENQFTTLDLANLRSLRNLSCYSNHLHTLKLSYHPDLMNLDCAGNQLTSLDVSQNPELAYLGCSINRLKSLDLSNNKKLCFLNCSNNEMTSLDVIQNTQLYHLDCSINSIPSVNITTCPALVTAYDGYAVETELYWIYRSEDDYLSVDKGTEVLIFKSPVLLKGPSNKTVAAGKNAKFTADVFGSGLQYQWQYSKDGGRTWIDCTSSGYNTATFKFTAAPNHDNRLYRCAVSNSHGSLVTGSAKLRVVGITDPPAAQSVAPETKATFTIGASGSPAYQWQYSKDNGATWNDCSSTGYNKAAFSFTAKSSMNGRLYRCVVTKGSIEIVSEAAKLTVGSTAKPEISTQPSNKTVASGKTAKFTVTAAGSGLTYQWQYSKDNGSTWNNCSSAGYDTSSFSFSASASMNGRLYRCKVTNSAGSVTSSSAKLTISDVKPAITGQPSAKSVTAGKTAKFTVAAAGSGLTYQWYYSKDNGATWTKCTSAGSDTASFSFTAKASMNGRLYRCKVTNSYGSVTSSSAKLTVK